MLLFVLSGKSSKSGVIRSLSNKFIKKSGTAQIQEKLGKSGVACQTDKHLDLLLIHIHKHVYVVSWF